MYVSDLIKYLFRDILKKTYYYETNGNTDKNTATEEHRNIKL